MVESTGSDKQDGKLVLTGVGIFFAPFLIWALKEIGWVQVAWFIGSVVAMLLWLVISFLIADIIYNGFEANIDE